MPIEPVILSQLSNNKQDLLLSRQGLTDHDISELAVLLSKNSTVSTLDLSYNCITVAGIRKLLTLPLESLDLSFNRIGDEGAIELFTNSKISKLILANCNISDISMRYFATNTTIKYLNINYNPITYAALYDILKNKNIEEIKIDYLNIYENFRFFSFNVRRHLKENLAHSNQDKILSNSLVPQR